MRFLIAAAAVLSAGPALAYPVRVENCGRPLTFDAAPQRAVVHDIDMSEMAFALHLQPDMAGVTGISGWYKVSPAFKAAQGGVPGIKTYVLTESCAQVDKTRPRADMDLLYGDELALGTIFGKDAEAKAVVDGWRARVGAVAEAVKNRPAPSVFVYDSGEDQPFTAGRFAMPTALIEAAGGTNVLGDRPMSWGKTSWEDVAARDPQFLVLLDYQDGAGYRKLLDFLEHHPAMKETAAVKNHRFLPLRYEQLTPGPANIDAVEALAKALHPEAFATK